MSKFATLILAATLFTGASFAASPTPAPQKSASTTSYYWLHPKLGHVKVDKTTNAMVRSRAGGR